jgi:nucleotide-binding universal stress UspA family protein
MEASRILVGTDGSSTARLAVDRAAEVARITGASLTVLMAGSEAQSRPVVDAEVDRLRADGIDARGVVAGSDPASALVEEAEAGGYDLVVVGNKGMTGARRFFTLGSVPNKVSHHLPRNLLIVRTT